MNIDWVKIPALLWGVEALYNKVLFEAEFGFLVDKLEEAKELLESLDENSDFDFEKDFKRIAQFKKRIKKNKRIVKIFKYISTIIMLAIAYCVIGLLLRNTLCELFVLPWLLGFVVPNWLLKWSLLFFGLHYLIRLKLTAFLVFKPLWDFKQIENEIKIVKSRMSNKALNKALDYVTPVD